MLAGGKFTERKVFWFVHKQAKSLKSAHIAEGLEDQRISHARNPSQANSNEGENVLIIPSE